MDTNYKDLRLKEYNEFISVVERLGFMTLSNNCIGFPNLENMTEENQWHTDLPSDPWRWRVNIEKDKKAAYGKLFDKKPGYISLEWYPKFFAARRKRRSFMDMYEDGLMSIYAKQIYELFNEDSILAVHEIKAMAGFTKELNSKYESAMIELQMGMFITVNGTKQKISAKGEPYGWPSTAYSKVETWAKEIVILSDNINPEDAKKEILLRIEEIVPDAQPKKVNQFLGI